MPAMANNANWQVAGPWAEAAGGAAVYGGGGEPVNPGTAASRLDMLRMGTARTPDAEYPDGLAQTVNGRYRDKLAAKLQDRLSDRAYQRGVHKDAKQPPQAYQWPVDLQPDSGLQREAQGVLEGNVILCPSYTSATAPDVRFRYGMSVSDPEMASIYRAYGINATTGQATDSVNPAFRAVAERMLPTTSW